MVILNYSSFLLLTINVICMEKQHKIEIHKESLEEKQKEKIIVGLLESIKENTVFLGEGRAADVFSYENEDYCVKEIVRDKIEFATNDIHEEIRMQKEAIKFGIRSPDVLLSAETDDGRKFIVMERIRGYSLKDIFDPKKKEAEFPSGFDAKKFFNELEKMLQKMHSEGMHHRDFHSGNVMVELKTGMPVIIDYGFAAYSYGEEDPYREENFPRIGHVTQLPKDINYFKELKNETVEATSAGGIDRKRVV